MRNRHSLNQFVHEAGTAGDTYRLQEHWMEFVSQFGISGYRIVPATLQLMQLVYTMLEFRNKPKLEWLPSPHLPKQPDTVIDIAHRTPPGWREYYNEQRLYRYDPIVARGLARRGPFTRKEALAEFRSPEAERMIAEAKEFGISGVISMSLWLGQDTLVGISLYFPHADIKADDTTKHLLRTASYLFCARHKELATTLSITEGMLPKLTPRELDVLRWIALGKTKHEIAERLQVSTSCIKRHCENIYLKLDVNNMASAVARAMSYGLIVV